MKREFAYSVALHLAVVAATLITMPFSVKPKIDPGEVIHVSLTSFRAPTPPTPVPPSPTVPKAVVAPQKAVPVKQPDAKTLPKKKTEQAKPKKQEKKPYRESPEEGAEDVAGTATGSTEIKEAAGSPFAGARTDNPNFQYDYWFDQAFYKLNANFKSPVDVQGKLVCVIHFQIIRSGRVIQATIDQGSGIRAFDDACLNAVYRSAPFPPLPREYGDEIIGMWIPFTNQF